MDKFAKFGKAALLLVVLALILITAANCDAEKDEPSESKINWLYDWDEALDKAKDENKLIMIDFYSDWCIPCKQLDSETFSDEELSAFLNDNFICLKSNVDEDSLHENYGIPYLPVLRIYPGIFFPEAILALLPGTLPKYRICQGLRCLQYSLRGLW